MCIYIYIYIYICIYVYTYIYIYMCTHTHTCLHTHCTCRLNEQTTNINQNKKEQIKTTKKHIAHVDRRGHPEGVRLKAPAEPPTVACCKQLYVKTNNT